MAKIEEQIIVIKFSRLIKDRQTNSESTDIVGEDVISSLEQAAENLAGPGITVEIETV